MHDALRAETSVDDVVVCFHIDEDHCGCRKPKPGMLVQAAQRWFIDPARLYMLGDRWRDIEAGRKAGCKTVLVRRG
jgi:D-glycero-D-manno-heptose 1,7-bisphosphate phosphatase